MTEQVKKDASSIGNSIGKHLINKADDGNWVGFDKDFFQKGGHLFGPQSKMFNLATTAACLDISATDVSKTPLHMKRITPNGSEIVNPSEHNAARLLAVGPNRYQDIREFLRVATYQLAMNSEFFIAPRRTNRGELLEFVGIPKKNTSDAQVNTAEREWYFDIRPSSLHDQALFGWAAGRKSLSEITHIRRRTVDGYNIIPTSVIAAESLGLLNQMMEVQKGNYENGGIPQLAFTFPDGLTEEQFNRLQNGLEKAMINSKKTGKPIVLEGSEGQVPQVEKLSQSMGDIEFVKSNSTAAMDILRYFRMPPHKIYIFGDIKYDNLEAAERVYVDDSLCSYYSDIQNGLSRALLTDDERLEYFFEFDVESAYAMNPKERHEIVRSKWISGMITRNQMLQKIGENTLPPEEGDVYMFSGNFVMTDTQNNVILRAGGNSADDGEKKPDEDADEGSGDEKSEKNIRLVQ